MSSASRFLPFNCVKSDSIIHPEVGFGYSLAPEVRFRTLPPRRKIFILILHERKTVSAERIAMFFCYIQYTRTHKKKKQGKYRKGKAALQFRQGCRCCLPKDGEEAQKGSMQYAAWTMKGRRKRK